MITTRHDLHAKMVIETITSGKNVFVEKPLAINGEELDAILNVYNNQTNPKSISVGFNRRFSPFSKKIKTLIGTATDSLNMIATMNAGFIPLDVWVHDMKTGGVESSVKLVISLI
jgi:predicted dehydrogenase